MSYVADLHTHSPFAIGTSRHLTFEIMVHWAKLKGIDVLSSGDFTHPAWLSETRTKLREGDDGLLELGGVKFVLGTEVNCVAEQNGRRRRVHMLLLAPSLRTVDRLNESLGSRGSLEKDGRPTLRLTPRDLVRTVLDIDSSCLIIPAHLWTPWFGLYGSKSGFDSLEECFGDEARSVYAVETGLSSDPAMNWRVPSLDAVSLVSFSDAHSPQNLGRELTVFPGPPSYQGLARCLKDQRIEYTVEFFPQEGKYHHSGHRKCGTCLGPDEVRDQGDRCPRCGRRITLGVMQRVEELASRDPEIRVNGDGLITSPNGRPPFRNLVPLAQILSESLGVGPKTKKTQAVFMDLVSELDGELNVLVETPTAEIARIAGERVAEGVARVRARDISIEPGYDGQYGTVKIWPEAKASKV